MKPKKQIQNEQPQQIQLNLPDYRYEYEQWLQKQEIKKEDSVVIIDIY
jgi:hypothetical protein